MTCNVIGRTNYLFIYSKNYTIITCNVNKMNEHVNNGLQVFIFYSIAFSTKI